MYNADCNYRSGRVALRKESVDRNHGAVNVQSPSTGSLSARRAWIEICGGACARRLALVALRKESVDRNVRLLMYFWLSGRVALRKESVDRNFVPFDVIRPAIVALRKESVDRNAGIPAHCKAF